MALQFVNDEIQTARAIKPTITARVFRLVGSNIVSIALRVMIGLSLPMEKGT
jgi:hypothetical protein